jgi:Mrp family chromosome partitioning ATPase
MTNSRASLVERAAEIYDFASGLPVSRPPEDLPPPRVRPRPAVEVAAPSEAGPGVKSPSRPVHHARVELDRAILAQHGLIAPDAPAATSLAEEVRLIKRRLLAAVDERAGHQDDKARIVLVASGQPGDGKTFIAANLALSIAGEQDRSVLLIDGDSLKPELMARLGVEDGPGFVDVVADQDVDPETLVLDTDVGRLSVLPAGRKERNIPELLSSSRTEAVLERLLSADPRRIIVIDSPPVLAASSAAVLAGYAGQTLVVVRADRTAEADLNQAIDLLSACDHLSLVLNSAAFQVGSKRFARYEEYR